MKKYVLKSVIIFTMILILGLILIPMIPTEKEYIYSNGYELLIDNETVSFNGFDGYSVNLPINDYKLISVSFTIDEIDMSVFTNLFINTKTYINVLGQDVLALYLNNDEGRILAVNTGQDLGDVLVSVWGVSR